MPSQKTTESDPQSGLDPELILKCLIVHYNMLNPKKGSYRKLLTKVQAKVQSQK